MFNRFDIIIVGAGISGCTLAERYANTLGRRVLVLEKREHIGGNCYDYLNHAGILVSKYGAHIFHTDDHKVWNYVNQFTKWRPTRYHAVSYCDGRLVPIPVNICTVNTIFGINLNNPSEMRTWLDNNTSNAMDPKNSEDAALKRVGRVLYEKLFKGYTIKQWDTEPINLEASVLNRIPVHLSFENNYFDDVYQAVPVDGYTKMFERMLSNPNIKVICNIDYFSVKDQIKNFKRLFFTGPIDRFFENKHQKLQYRSLRFEYETYNKEWYQEYPAVHFPNDFEYTRIIEYKHITGQVHHRTTISKEYPSWVGEPFYPVPTDINRQLYDKYQHEAAVVEKDNIFFVGRLANYKYFNMDQAFRNALDLFNKIESISYEK